MVTLSQSVLGHVLDRRCTIGSTRLDEVGQSQQTVILDRLDLSIRNQYCRKLPGTNIAKLFLLKMTAA